LISHALLRQLASTADQLTKKSSVPTSLLSVTVPSYSQIICFEDGYSQIICFEDGYSQIIGGYSRIIRQKSGYSGMSPPESGRGLIDYRKEKKFNMNMNT